MKVCETEISGLWIAQTNAHADKRGSFGRIFCESELEQIIGTRRVVQVNHSVTMRSGCIRGLHFQRPPMSEMKLIRCVQGRVWDVAVDLRRSSSTFLRWHAEELSPSNGKMMIIPEGFAHGFQVLEPGSEMLYFHTAMFSPGFEGTIKYDDPLIGIRWPYPTAELSDRDASAEILDLDFKGLKI